MLVLGANRGGSRHRPKRYRNGGKGKLGGRFLRLEGEGFLRPAGNELSDSERKFLGGGGVMTRKSAKDH